MLKRTSFDSIVKKCFRSVGLEVQRFAGASTEEAVLSRVLAISSVDCVVDVGANVGQYVSVLRGLGYRGRVVSFEALPSVHQQLIKVARRDSEWHVAPCAALGREDGILAMHVAGNLASSSLLPMNEVHKKAAPESAVVGVEKVRVMRLDSTDLVSSLFPSGGLLLKIDTQGYEREVLEGSSGLMNRILSMQIELSLVELYEGSPRIAEIVSYVDSLGFDLFNVAPGFKDKSTGQLLQMDGFFVRRSLLNTELA